ncbi:major facilitator superfamily domain-containing protein 4A-like isoform X2 [Convolutriloba macropyga]|uniref:major facilitator superfamily domain-containing protein 4A-like isoform X2 n=1 Tax=Convolutriloba macropyga TaxID=536237 RepID=UPI003F51B568
MSVVPLCETRTHLLINFMVMGIFMGQIDTVANVRLIQIYGNCVAPFLQALHFCYGLGAFLSPIIAEPFLNNQDCSDLVSDVEKNQASRNETLMLHSAAKTSNVGNAYLVYSIVQIPTSLLLIVIIIMDSAHLIKRKISCSSIGSKPVPKDCETSAEGGSYQQLDDSNEQSSSSSAHKDDGRITIEEGQQGTETSSSTSSQHEPEVQSKIPIHTTYVILSMIGFILFFADAAQSAYGSYIYSYSSKNSQIEMSATTGAYLTASFWGCFALGRLLSIPLSALVSSPVMLFVNLCGSGLAMVLFFMFRDRTVVIFIATAIYGLFLSSIYPSGIAMAEEYLSISSFMTSVLVMFAAAGEMCTPLLVGWLFDNVGPVTLIYYELSASVFGLFLLFLALLVAFNVISKQDASKTYTRIGTLCPWWWNCIGIHQPNINSESVLSPINQSGSNNKNDVISRQPTSGTACIGAKSYSSINN